MVIGRQPRRGMRLGEHCQIATGVMLGRDSRTVVEQICFFILAVCLAHAVYYLWVGLANPILDYFSLRQTQTALTAY